MEWQFRGFWLVYVVVFLLLAAFCSVCALQKQNERGSYLMICLCLGLETITKSKIPNYYVTQLRVFTLCIPTRTIHDRMYDIMMTVCDVV